MALGSVSLQILTTALSGTYTAPARLNSALVTCVGGGGTGADATAADEAGCGGGGGGSATALLPAATIGASQDYEVEGALGCNFGSGPLVSSTHGTAGTSTAQGTTLGTQSGTSNGGLGSGGDVNSRGMRSGNGVIFDTTNGIGGLGGCSAWARGGGGAPGGTNVVGGSGHAKGGGGAGGHANANPDRSGGALAPGVIVVLEFIDAEEAAQSGTLFRLNL